MRSDSAKRKRKVIVRRLWGIQPFEVSAVPAGANGRRLVAKADDPAPSEGSMKITVESLERAHGVLTDSIAVLKQGMPDFRAEGMIAKRVSETFIDLIGAPAVQAGEVRKSLDEILTVTKALSEATVDMTSLDRIDTIRDGLQALVAKLDETPVFASSPAPAEPAVPATPPAPAEAAPAGAPGTSGAPTPAAPALAEPAIPAVPTEPAIAAPLPAEPSAPAPAPVEAAVPAPAPVAPTPPVEGAVEKAVAPAAPVAPPAPVPGLVLSDLTKAFSDAALAMGKTIAAELKSAMQAVPGNVVKTAPAGVPVVAPTVAAPPAEPVPPPPAVPAPAEPSAAAGDPEHVVKAAPVEWPDDFNADRRRKQLFA